MPYLTCPFCLQSFTSKASQAKERVCCSRQCQVLYRQTQEQIKKRFWASVDISGRPDSCWLWRGARSKSGYGNFRINYKQHKAHRLAYEFTYGPICDGLFACHHCDNPPCCNPHHLFLGTAQDNSDDFFKKGRKRKEEPFEVMSQRSRGSGNGRAKLSESDIPCIRKLQGGKDIKEVAKLFHVSPSMVRFIWKGENWRHVPVT